MKHEQLLLDGSIIFDIEALETAADILSSTEQTVFVPESIYGFVNESGDYRDFQKSAPAKFFGKKSIPPSDYILDILDSEQVELYGPESDEYNGYGENFSDDLYGHIQDATQYYSQFAGYLELINILVEEFNYLFTSSIIIAAKDKISDTAERIGAIVARGNERVRDEALKHAVEGYNLWNDRQERFIGKYKLSLIAVPLVGVNAPAGSALAVLEFLLEGAISDRLVIALDP